MRTVEMTGDDLQAGVRFLVRQGFLSGFVTALVDEIGLSKADANRRVAAFAKEFTNAQVQALIDAVIDPSTPRYQLIEVEVEA